MVGNLLEPDPIMGRWGEKGVSMLRELSISRVLSFVRFIDPLSFPSFWGVVVF